MNKELTKLFFISIIFFSNRIFSQDMNGYMIKTELSKSIIGKSPNLGIERILNERFSVQLEGIWKRRDRASSGGEKTGNTFRPSSGYSVILSTRYYFSKPRKMPFTYFASAFLRYNSTRIDTVHKVYSISGFYKRTVNLYRQGPEIGVLLGRQFLIAHGFTADINGGVSNYFVTEEQTYVAGETSPEFVNGKYKRSFQMARPHLNVSVGYFFGRKR